MQLGMVGLGRMGANLVRRLMRDGPRMRGLRREPGGGRRRSWPKARPARRPSTSSSPRSTHAARRVGDGAGRVRRRHGDGPRRDAWSRATSSSTAATPTTATTSTGPRSSPRSGIHYVDSGTSGGVFGLERGFCLMIGGEDRDRRPTSTRSSRRSRPGVDAAPRTEGRTGDAVDRGAGLPPLRPGRRRPLREDGPQRHRVRDDGGVRRGPERAASTPNVGTRHAGRGRRDDAAARPAVLPVRPRPARGRRGVAAGQRDRVVAARPRRARVLAVADARRLRGSGLGLGRGALDRTRRDRRGRADPRAVGRAVRPLRVARRVRLRRTSSCPRCARSSVATTRRRNRGIGRADALCWFGATGDLGYKMTIPALYAMARHGHLDVPVIGVAHATR